MKNEITNSTIETPVKNNDYYHELQFKASVLYIRYSKSAKQISKELNVSLTSLSKWMKAGRWDELRPELSIVNEFRAASLYVIDGLTPAQIAMKLSVSETTVKIWVHCNKWDFVKEISQTQDMVKHTINIFSKEVKTMLPEHGLLVNSIAERFIAKNLTKLERIDHD